MNNKAKKSVFISTIIGWLVLGTVVYHSLEDWSYITSFYFSAVSLTTVGYGDLYPTSEISRLFTAFYVLGGTAIVVVALGFIGSNLLEKKVLKKDNKNKKESKK